jgi:hypothetical protein
MQRRLGFFTSPVEINKIRPNFLQWQKFTSAINVIVGRSMVRIEKGGKLHD